MSVFGDHRSTVAQDDRRPGAEVTWLLGGADWLAAAVVAVVVVAAIDVMTTDRSEALWLAAGGTVVVGVAQLLALRRVHPSVAASAVIAAIPPPLVMLEMIDRDELPTAGTVDVVWGSLGPVALVVVLVLCACHRARPDADVVDVRRPAPGATVLLATLLGGEVTYYVVKAATSLRNLEALAVMVATVVAVVAVCLLGDRLRHQRLTAWRALLFATACGPAVAYGSTALFTGRSQRTLLAVVVVAVLLLATASVAARVRSRRAHDAALRGPITYLARVP